MITQDEIETFQLLFIGIVILLLFGAGRGGGRKVEYRSVRDILNIKPAPSKDDKKVDD